MASVTADDGTARWLLEADNMLLAEVFSKLHQRYSLILVDWRQRFVLTGLSHSGQLELWRP